MSTKITIKGAEIHVPDDNVQLDRSMADWDTEEPKNTHNVSVIATADGIWIAACREPGQPADSKNAYQGMEVKFEINRGVPCLHIGTITWGEPDISLFFTNKGIVIRPDRADTNVRDIVPDDVKDMRDPNVVLRQANSVIVPTHNAPPHEEEEGA